MPLHTELDTFPAAELETFTQAEELVRVARGMSDLETRQHEMVARQHEMEARQHDLHARSENVLRLVGALERMATSMRGMPERRLNGPHVAPVARSLMDGSVVYYEPLKNGRPTGRLIRLGVPTGMALPSRWVPACRCHLARPGHPQFRSLDWIGATQEDLVSADALDALFEAVEIGYCKN